MRRPEPQRRVSVTAAINLAAALARRQGVPDWLDLDDPRCADLDRMWTDAANMIRGLADEVTALRRGLYEIAERAEDGLSTSDLYAYCADALGIDAGELRRWCEGR